MIAILNNPMLTATEKSYKKALKISKYHDNALSADKADPFILALYNTFHVLHLNLNTAIEDWDLQGDQQQGTTSALNQIIEVLSDSKIREWDIIIQGKYNINTPEYKTLLPNHRVPFQNGTQLERLRAVSVLSEALGMYSDLDELKSSVDVFTSRFKTAYDNQKEHMNVKTRKSETVENARVAMCIGQYANMGGLIQKYAANPEKILRYFDMSVLGNNIQTEFTGKLKPQQVYTIAKHTFHETDEISLSNTGNTTLKFYLAPARKKQSTGQGITLAPGKKIELASALGNLTDPYLTVVNTDTNQSGSFEVEIL